MTLIFTAICGILTIGASALAIGHQEWSAYLGIGAGLFGVLAGCVGDSDARKSKKAIRWAASKAADASFRANLAEGRADIAESHKYTFGS